MQLQIHKVMNQSCHRLSIFNLKIRKHGMIAIDTNHANQRPNGSYINHVSIDWADNFRVVSPFA